MGSHRVGHDWSNLAAAAARHFPRFPQIGIQGWKESSEILLARSCSSSGCPSDLPLKGKLYLLLFWKVLAVHVNDETQLLFQKRSRVSKRSRRQPRARAEQRPRFSTRLLATSRAGSGLTAPAWGMAQADQVPCQVRPSLLWARWYVIWTRCWGSHRLHAVWQLACFNGAHPPPLRILWQIELLISQWPESRTRLSCYPAMSRTHGLCTSTTLAPGLGNKKFDKNLRLTPTSCAWSKSASRKGWLGNQQRWPSHPQRTAVWTSGSGVCWRDGTSRLPLLEIPVIPFQNGLKHQPMHTCGLPCFVSTDQADWHLVVWPGTNC